MADGRIPDLVHRPSRLRALADIEANAESSANALDRIARTACRVLDVPVVLVNLVGAERQHFVSCAGPEPWASMTEMPLTAGFCPFALASEDAYAFSDARTDPELADNVAVTRHGVVAYAGVPLRTTGGEPVGTLCAVDHRPRDWSEDDLGLLADLAAGVIAELQLLTATRLLARDQARLRTLAELSSALAPARPPGEVADEVMRAVARLRPSEVRLEVGDRTVTAVSPDAPPVAVEHRFGPLTLCFSEDRAFTADDHAYLAAVGGVSALALARS